MEAAALHQAQCRLLVARASRRLLLRGVWSLRVDPGRGLAELRSLKWPGYFGYHLVATPKYGAVYFGDGIENSSLQFMV